MRYLLPFIFLILCLACEGNTAARKAAKGPYYVSDPDHLYFKNTRLRHYRADESKQEVTIYRHDDLLASEATVFPLILDNWLEDEATLRFDVRRDPARDAVAEPFRMDVLREEGWQSLRLSVPPLQQEVVELRQLLAASRELRVVMGVDTLSPFPGEAREAAKEILDDYLRLIGTR